MNFLKRFMYGRNGMDHFSLFLLIVSLIIFLLARIFSFYYLGIIALILVIYAYFRVLSKNISKRQMENAKFLSFLHPVQNSIKNSYLIAFGSKTHKYYKCPKCKQMLRVPRGKGTIQITCNRCKKEFIKKT